MKITIEYNDETVSINVPQFSDCGHEMADIFKRMMLAMGFHPMTVRDCFMAEGEECDSYGDEDDKEEGNC